MSGQRKLSMSVDLNVIEHLGMNLYSNTPAVLSEVVANAWDADASNVWIRFDIEAQTISVRDDGAGMTRDQVIDQYLKVGYRRRAAMPTVTPKHGRHPMGRKGIGKLSCFSIADAVSVFTVHEGERTAFRMNVNDMQAQLARESNSSYDPHEDIPWFDELVHDGTCVVLSELKRKVTQSSVKYLRQRIARRFSVLGSKSNFVMKLNGEEVLSADRGYFDGIEFIWTYLDQANPSIEIKEFPNIVRHVDRNEAIAAELQASIEPLTIRGWLGTVKNPGLLKDEGGQSLNRIAIFMRGKVCQEDILAEFSDKRLYADYLVGEIYCDELDADETNDIATSSRQDLKMDDPRVVELKRVIGKELAKIQAQWSDWRVENGVKHLIQGIPEVEAWLNGLQGDTQRKAQRWVGRLNLLRSDKDDSKRELLKGSILAFESYRRREQLDFLEHLGDENIEKVLEAFNDIDELQMSYYGQIVKFRVAVIKALETKLNEDEYETALREHIYNHLWLIDPSWERVRGTEVAERTIGKFLHEQSEKLPTAERRARIDIGYRAASGRHVVIELKRGSASIPVDTLSRQVRKYRSGVSKLISEGENPSWPLEIVCVVGKPPPEWGDGSGRKDVETSLKAVDARLVFYQQLLENAYKAYEDYLETHKTIDPLWEIFEAIENFDPVTDP